MTTIQLILHSVDSSLDVANEFINVFGYRSNLIILNELPQFLDAVVADLLPAIADVISGTTSMVRLEAKNVTDGVGYLDRVLTPTIPGAQGGDPLPRFTAWGYKYQRATAGARSGAKRFGRITENGVLDGNATAGSLVLLNTLAAQLAAPLRIGLVDTWFPVILERKPPGVFPWTEHAIAGVTYQRVTTQNSRKR